MQQASQHPVSPSEASDTANPRRDPAERFSEPASQLIRPQRFVSKTAPGTAQRRVLASLKSYRSAAQREPKFRRLVPRLLVATFLIAALALFGIWSLNSGGDTKVASQVISGKTKPSATNSPAPTAAASEAGPAVTSAARSASSRGGRQRVPYVPAETQPSGTGQDAGTEVASTGMEWPGLTGLALQRAASSPLPVPVGATPATLSQVVTSTDLLEEQKVATTYTVQDGDTIWDIAAANGVSVDLILSANNIGPDDILPLGRELTIPIQGQSQPTASPTPEAQPTPSPTAQQQQTTKTYVVQPGDTIWSIAADNGVSVDALLAANSMSEDDILALGRELTIPTEVEAQPSVSPTQPASPTPTAQPSPTPAPQGGHDIKTYVVQPGDTLSGIAAANGVSVETILWANNLTEDAMLRVGQELIVPPTDGVIYTVQEGDTLQGIAQEFGVDAQTIADYNGIADPSMISAGMKLVIPGGKPAGPAASEPAGQSAPSPESSQTPEPQPAVAAAPESTPEPAPAPEATPAPQPTPEETPAPEPTATPTPEPTAAPAPTDGSAGEKIVEIAKRYIGTPYVWGGTTPAGFDCSGFVYYVYKQAGVPIPRDIYGQLAAGRRIDRNNLMPGDIVFFQNTYKAGLSHVGIYVGGGNFIEAVTFGVPLKISALWSSYYAAHYYGACRPW